MTQLNSSEILTAIRADKYVGRGSLSYVDECYSDTEIKEILERDGIKSIKKAIAAFISIQDLLWENELETKSNWEDNRNVPRNWKAFVDAGYPSNKPVAEPMPYTVELPEGFGIHDGFGLCACPCHTHRMMNADNCWCFYEVDCRAREEFDGDYQALRKHMDSERREWEEREAQIARLDLMRPQDDLPF